MSSLVAARQNILRSGRGATVPLHDIILKADSSSIDLDNLIGNADAEYLIRIWGLGVGVVSHPAISINDDNVAANASYDILYHSTNVAGDSAISDNNKDEFFLTPSLLSADDQFFAEVLISGKSGLTAGHNIESKFSSAGGAETILKATGLWKDAAEINKITFRSGGAFVGALFGIGTRVQLFTF